MASIFYKKHWLWVLVIIVFSIAVFIAISGIGNERVSKEALEKSQQWQGVGQPLSTDEKEGVLVRRVTDGDTIEIEGGKRIRYLGIDTPETVDPRKPIQCFGREASSRNKELVDGKRIRLEKDISETDKYGRLLRYVYLNDVFVNLELVKEGYAFAVSYPPDVKYQEELRAAEREARRNKRGLWSACLIDQSSTGRLSTEPASPNCKIKGNISFQSGAKIYFLPGCDYYNKTVINESQGEKWFCSEAEALAAGWRKAKNCF